MWRAMWSMKAADELTISAFYLTQRNHRGRSFDRQQGWRRRGQRPIRPHQTRRAEQGRCRNSKSSNLTCSYAWPWSRSSGDREREEISRTSGYDGQRHRRSAGGAGHRSLTSTRKGRRFCSRRSCAWPLNTPPTAAGGCRLATSTVTKATSSTTRPSQHRNSWGSSWGPGGVVSGIFRSRSRGRSVSSRTRTACRLQDIITTAARDRDVVVGELTRKRSTTKPSSRWARGLSRMRGRSSVA